MARVINLKNNDKRKQTERFKTVFLAIGSNRGDRKENIETALRLLHSEKDIEIVKVSAMLKNPPQEGIKTGYFLNGAIKVLTLLSPHELLNVCKNIEKCLGRDTEGRTYRPRVIDLDILFYEDKIINTKDLVIPHPRLHKRNFVLIPMMEIGKDFRHPVSRKTILELYKNVVITQPQPALKTVQVKYKGLNKVLDEAAAI